MGNSGKGKPPLVADRRYSKKKATPKKAAPKKRAAAKPARRKSARKPGKRRNPVLAFVSGIFLWVFRIIWRFTWGVTTIIALLLAGAIFYFQSSLPPVADLLDGRARGSVTLLDRNGSVFAWRGEQFGGSITTDTVSPFLKNAIVATEDRRFYRHVGVSPRGVASAIRINLREGRGPLSGHGGSTITQQTAKLLCLGVPYDPETWKSEAAYEADCRRTTLWRKVKEATFALAMEVKYTKDEILTIYLNRAYLGAGARGFQAAAERYFGKSASEVNASEGAMLAGLLVAPSTYAPTNNLKRAQDRANLVLGLMETQGYLTKAEADNARAHPATLSKAAAARAGGYFADWVIDEAPWFLTSATTEDVIVRTTFDSKLQKAAEEAMDYIFANKVKEGSKAQAAIVVMSSDGAVRAMVGGRETKVSGAFNRASMAKRQTGSAFKPFVYAAALDLGYTPNSTIVDEPFCMNVPGSGQYCPKNYTKNFHGRVTLTEALRDSLNIPAVRVSESVGRDIVRKVATDFGIDSSLAKGPALALGASESTLIEMTGAYAGILNGGRAVRPYGMIELRLQGEGDSLMGQDGGMRERVISTQAAQSLIYMMNQVIENGTGKRARLEGRQAAGKTGTTQAARDAWFIGFTADYVAGVWMGYDDNTPLTGVTGGGLPAEIWHETMTRVHNGLPARPLPMLVPEPVRQPVADDKASKKKKKKDNQADAVLNDVLRRLLGKN